MLCHESCFRDTTPEIDLQKVDAVFSQETVLLKEQIQTGESSCPSK